MRQFAEAKNVKELQSFSRVSFVLSEGYGGVCKPDSTFEEADKEQGAGVLVPACQIAYDELKKTIDIHTDFCVP